MTLVIDRSQISQFVFAIFRYAGTGVFISLRTFLEQAEGPPQRITAVELPEDTLKPLLDAAALDAGLAANASEAQVFCPPLAGFSNGRGAKEADLVEGYAISVECDANPVAAQKKLTDLLGPPTVTVRSGGEWSNPETGKVEPKTHLHWRLTEAATDGDLSRLKEARRLAATLVGGDPTAVSVVHPLRWPGSWHRKGEPRLVEIAEIDAEREIDLGEALDRLREAMAASGPPRGAAAVPAAPANDDREFSELVRGVVSGESLHPNLVPLAARMVGAGMVGGAVVNTLRGMMEASAAPRDDRWKARYDDLSRTVWTAEQKFGRGDIHQARVEEPAIQMGEIEPGGFTGVLPPPRPWAYGDFLMERAVTGVAAPPGVGKTTFSFQIAIAFGLDLQLGPWSPRPGGGGRVWLYNGEEPKDELDRRFIAACAEMGAQEADAASRVAYNSGLEKSFRLGRVNEDGVFERSADVDRIKEIVRRERFKLFIIDPLIEFHSVKENDTEAFGEVGKVAREIAHDCDCAVLIFHHTPKAATADTAAGDMNAMRGGGSLIGVARFVHTLFAMTKRDADELGVSAKDRGSFVRWDHAKANMAPATGEAIWWRKLGVGIDNAAAPRPADQIGVLRHAHLQPAEMDPSAVAAERQASAESGIQRLAAEIVRVCCDNGHTAPEKATALKPLCEALDTEAIGMKATTARNLVIGRMAKGCEANGFRVVVTTNYRGALALRNVHVEELSDAA